MIPVPAGVKVWLATGHTDMRRGFPGLSLMVQETLKRDPMCGHLFVFRGRGGGLIKVIWHDGQGACLFHEEAGTRTLHMAVGGRWDGSDYPWAARLFAGRHRLADAAKNLATDLGRMSKNAAMAKSNMIPSVHERCGRTAS